MAFAAAMPHFQNDTQFMRLVRRESDVDLVLAALEIARDEQPEVRFEPTLAILKKSVSKLTHPITQAGSEVEELKLLVRYMTEELGLRGDSDGSDDPDVCYVNRVLETGRGLPIAVSLIYLWVANRLGIAVEPISFNPHFLLRLPTDHGALYVDTADAGQIMTEKECVELLKEKSQRPISEIRRALKPADDMTIVTRLLHHLKGLYCGTESWNAAWKVQHRLAVLIPGSYRERRDLAVMTLRAGRAGEAIGLLERCMRTCPQNEKQYLQQHLRQAYREAPLAN